MAKSITLRCEHGHEQTVTFTPEMSDDEAHDFGVLLAGGRLKSLGIKMPGYRCQWSENEAPRCDARVTFEID